MYAGMIHTKLGYYKNKVESTLILIKAIASLGCGCSSLILSMINELVNPPADQNKWPCDDGYPDGCVQDKTKD